MSAKCLPLPALILPEISEVRGDRAVPTKFQKRGGSTKTEPNPAQTGSPCKHAHRAPTSSVAAPRGRGRETVTPRPSCSEEANLHRHHKRIMSRTGSGDSPAAPLKWDYSGISLSNSEKAPQAPSDTALTLNLTANENRPGEKVNNMASSDTKILQLIHGTVRELQTETRAENRKARVTTKQLLVIVWKIAKLCSEIEEKLNTVESRTLVVEGEMAALKDHVVTQSGQLTDVMWK
ncbi:hypothetical protein NDU88_005341 [Pleurodeles waltl]|uniref:Uncharacterized protein n=1 Tax=Pleurodeles waltl TaxID=8319 RepID=A0AAV7TAE7_PLEWA|nr:hypothetical protein NDU88_005341 [Pleurodeles waltl]